MNKQFNTLVILLAIEYLFNFMMHSKNNTPNCEEEKNYNE